MLQLRPDQQEAQVTMYVLALLWPLSWLLLNGS